MMKSSFVLLALTIQLITSSPPLNSSADGHSERRSITPMEQVNYRHFLSTHHRYQQPEVIDISLKRLPANISSNSSSTLKNQSTSGTGNRHLPPQQIKQHRQGFNKLPRTRSMAIDMAAEGDYFRQHRNNAHRRQTKSGSHKKRHRQQMNEYRIQPIQVSKDAGHPKKRQESSLTGLGFVKDKKSNIKNDLDIRGLENKPSVLVVTKMANLKKEMCKSEPLPQRVREPGCRPKMISNRFCYGQCNSFYIPKGGMKGVAVEASLDKTAFKSCSFCRPKKVESVTVTLHCPGLPQRFVRKHIQVIRHCTCSALSVK